MRQRFEFALHTVPAGEAGAAAVDPALALMGSQGWEIRGIAPAAGAGGESVVVALQRPLDEELPLPDAPTLAATLDEPLAVPTYPERLG
jgi:hypothetical protein